MTDRDQPRPDVVPPPLVLDSADRGALALAVLELHARGLVPADIAGTAFSDRDSGVAMRLGDVVEVLAVLRDHVNAEDSMWRLACERAGAYQMTAGGALVCDPAPVTDPGDGAPIRELIDPTGRAREQRDAAVSQAREQLDQLRAELDRVDTLSPEYLFETALDDMRGDAREIATTLATAGGLAATAAWALARAARHAPTVVWRRLTAGPSCAL